MAQKTLSYLPAAGGTLFGLAFLVCAGVGNAQTMSANSSSFNGGWGRANGSENQSVALSMVSRDENGNRVIIDGIIQTGAQTVSARASAAATASAGYTGGVGGGGALAVGNSLNVVTTGDYNTVIVNSAQTNTGNISANVNGGVGQ